MITDKRRTLIFINILISCIATSMLITALTTTLPAIVYDFHITFTLGQWLTSGYSLVMGITMPLTAFLITRFPTKQLYLAGLGITILGLFFCAISPNFQVMMLARGLQACGAGIITSMGQVILLTIYPPEVSGTVMGWYGLSMGSALAIAPLLAGLVVDAFGWRAIFCFAILVLAVPFFCAMYAFDNVLPTEKKRMDMPSFLLSAAAFSGLTLGIGNIISSSIGDLRAWLALGVGAATMVLFVHRQLHSSRPFLDLRVFTNKNYTLSVIGGAINYFIMMGLAMILPMYVQSICGYSATVSGLVKLPGVLAMAVASLCAGKIYDRIGIKRLFIVGALVMLVSMGMLSIVTVSTSIWVVTTINLVYNIAVGCLQMPLVSWGVYGLSGTMTTHGSALISTIRTVAGSMGTAVFVGIMTVAPNLFSAAYGEGALLTGFNAACLFMALCTIILLLTAAFLRSER